MKIDAIRDAIRAAGWLRRHLTGGTAYEFVKQDVGPKLSAAINELKALDIPERFAAERAARDEEIGHCEDTVRSWLNARGQANVVTPTEPLIDIAPAGRLVFEPLKRPAREYGRADGSGPKLRVIDGGKKS